MWLGGDQQDQWQLQFVLNCVLFKMTVQEAMLPNTIQGCSLSVARDLTVAELGIAAGITTGMLSKIENGAISPSLATLVSLARALNVPISRLFAETDERRDCSFVKAGTGVRIERRGTKSGHKYDLLGHSLSGEVQVEPYLITLASDAVPYTQFRHAGMEFLYMLSGKVVYRHADRTYLMGPGDALFFDAAARHGPEELVEAPMQYLSIIIFPRRA